MREGVGEGDRTSLYREEKESDMVRRSNTFLLCMIID